MPHKKKQLGALSLSDTILNNSKRSTSNVLDVHIGMARKTEPRDSYESMKVRTSDTVFSVGFR